MKPTRTYPRLHIDTAPSNALGHAGGLLLTETVHTSGLDHHLKTALAPWKKPFAVHDPAKVLLDLAITLALGGDALSDSTALRDEPDLYGPVASNPTITRIIQTLASDVDRSLAAINQARAQTRTRVWELAGKHAPNHDADAQDPLIIDIDASLITAHSEKENAKPTYKKGFGFHPLLAFIDHGTVALVNLWPSCCVLETRDRTRLPITSAWSNSSSILVARSQPSSGQECPHSHRHCRWHP